MDRVTWMRRLWIIGLLGLLLNATQVAAQTGGPYDLTWNTLDGGGGQSSGGLYALAGTIGQPAAGQSSGGVYTLGGGFWGGGVANSFLNKKVYLPLVIK